MTDIAEALMDAMRAALRGSYELKVAMGGESRIYVDNAPKNAPMPYVRIGDDQIIDASDPCVEASEIVSQVHLWSNPEPPDGTQIRRMMAAVRKALRQKLPLEGHETVVFEFVDALFVPDPDGHRHCVMQFNYQTTALTV